MIAPFVGHRREFAAQFAEQRQVDLRKRLFERQRNGGVVDVLRRESEVYELFPRSESERIHFLFHEVFHCLDIMVRGCLDFLDAAGDLRA